MAQKPEQVGPNWINQSAQMSNVPMGVPADQMEQWAELAEMMGPLGDQERDIERQQTFADQLRGTKAPTGRAETGRVFTAASPLEFLGAGAQQYAGMKKGEELEAGRKGISGQMANNLRTWRTLQAQKQRQKELAQAGGAGIEVAQAPLAMSDDDWG